MRRLLLFALITLLTSFSFNSVFAVDSKVEVSTRYLLAVDGSAEAEMNLVGLTSTGETLVPLSGKNIRDVTAKSGDQDVEVTLDQDSKTIKFTTDKPNVQIKYKSDLAKIYGATKIFDIPSQDYGELAPAKETIVIQADVELGVGVARGPKPEVTSISLGEQVMTWVSVEGAFKESVGVLYGESSVADFNLNTKLKNNSWWWQTVEVVLPPDTNQQKVVLKNIEPKPAGIRLDIDGNIIAHYKIRPKGSVEVKASGEIHVFSYSYALNGSSGLSNVPSNLKDNYATTNDSWSGSKIDIEINPEQPVSKTIEEVFMAVHEQIPSEAKGLEESQSWANTLVGELRSVGVPARLILGQSYTDGIETFYSPRSFAWAEAYAPATGWVTLDPMVQRGMNLYGSSDVERLALVMRGAEAGYPPENLADYSFVWQNEKSEEPAEAVPTLKSTNNMILPGFAFKTVEVTMGSGTIVDGAAINVEGEGVNKLGSLAPLETSVSNFLAPGGSAFAATKVTYGVMEADKIGEVLAETTTTVSYLPMIMIIVTILLIIAVIVLLKRRSSKKSDSKPRKSNMVLADDDDGLSIENFDFDDEDVEDSGVPVVPEPTAEQVEELPRQISLQPKPVQQISASRPDVPKTAQNVTMNPQMKQAQPRRRPPRLIQ